MAKQPYNRFASVREFADTLQRALRNEPIEMFDSSRIRPRLLRAMKAFEQSDCQFAAEILGELEAEGHIDHDMTVPLPSGPSTHPMQPAPLQLAPPPPQPTPPQDVSARPQAGKKILWIATGVAVLVVAAVAALLVPRLLKKQLATEGTASGGTAIVTQTPTPLAPPQLAALSPHFHFELHL
jgi:hypothetical protein